MNVVIVGAREREDKEQDRTSVIELMRDLHSQYRRQLYVWSVGCDKGIGRYVKEFCMTQNVVFVENRMKLEGEHIPRKVFIEAFLARNAGLVHAGDEFYVYKGPYEGGVVEAVIQPAIAKVKEQRVKVFRYEGK